MFGKIRNLIFQKRGGGRGVKGHSKFSENSSILANTGLPYIASVFKLVYMLTCKAQYNSTRGRHRWDSGWQGRR